MHFVTLVDQDSLAQGRVEPLVHSLRHFGCELIILTDYQRRLGNWSKIVSFRNFLTRDTAIADGDVIAFVDALDVLAVGPPASLAPLLDAYSVDILLGAESTYERQSQANKKYFDAWYAPHARPYINSGLILGRKAALRALFHYVHAIYEKVSRISNRKSDQSILGYAFVAIKRGQESDLRMGIDFATKGMLNINLTTDIPASIAAPLAHVPGMRKPAQNRKYRALRARITPEGQGISSP